MEAESVEDGGAGLRFCVYVYNVQPGVAIDYRNGDSWLDADTALPEQEARSRAAYIVNINTDKFHYPDCSSVEDIREYNKLYFWGKPGRTAASGLFALRAVPSVAEGSRGADTKDRTEEVW